MKSDNGKPCWICSCFIVLGVILLLGLGGFVGYSLKDNSTPQLQSVVTEAAAPVQPVLQPQIEAVIPQPQAVAPPTPSVPQTPGTYVVQKGDTLWDLSEKFYGDPTKYMKIFQANDKVMWDPDRIYVGQTLNIPN